MTLQKLILFKKEKKPVILIFVITIITFSIGYFLHPARPGIHFLQLVNGQFDWRLWYDQSQYYHMSQTIVNGTFSSSDYVYGLGYPILGIPFGALENLSSIFSDHQFFLPNLLLLIGIIYITFDYSNYLNKNIKISFLCVILLLFSTVFLIWFIEPWNNHVLSFAVLAVFYLLQKNFPNASNKQLIIAGLIAGWTFSSRYVDVIWLLPMFATFLIFNPKKIVYLIPGVIVILIVIFSHSLFFDDPLRLPNQYSPILEDQKIEASIFKEVGLDKFSTDLSTIGIRTYCIFIYPSYCIPDLTGNEFVDDWWKNALSNKIPILANGFGILIFSPLGIWLLFRKFEGTQKWIFVSLIISFIASMIFYTSIYTYSSGWTPFFRYHLFWLPIFLIFSVYGIKHMFTKIKLK